MQEISATVLKPRLQNPNAATRLDAAKSVNPKNADTMVLRILGDLVTTDADQAVRVEAVKALGRVGRDTGTILLQALEHADAYVRREAVASLGKVGSSVPDAVPRLARALRDSDTKVRMGAATALGQMGPNAKDAIPELIEALRDNNLILCRLAAQALSLIGGAAVGPLTAALRHCDTGVRREAAWALGQIGPEASASIPALMEMLGNGSAPAPAAAPTSERPSAANIATAVINITPTRTDDTQVITELAVSAAPESDSKVRQAAVQALERIQGKK